MYYKHAITADSANEVPLVTSNGTSIDFEAYLEFRESEVLVPVDIGMYDAAPNLETNLGSITWIAAGDNRSQIVVDRDSPDYQVIVAENSLSGYASAMKLGVLKLSINHNRSGDSVSIPVGYQLLLRPDTEPADQSFTDFKWSFEGDAIASYFDSSYGGYVVPPQQRIGIPYALSWSTEGSYLVELSCKGPKGESLSVILTVNVTAPTYEFSLASMGNVDFDIPQRTFGIIDPATTPFGLTCTAKVDPIAGFPSARFKLLQLINVSYVRGGFPAGCVCPSYKRRMDSRYISAARFAVVRSWDGGHI